jgi:hypothetical protein
MRQVHKPPSTVKFKPRKISFSTYAKETFSRKIPGVMSGIPGDPFKDDPCTDRYRPESTVISYNPKQRVAIARISGGGGERNENDVV